MPPKAGSPPPGNLACAGLPQIYRLYRVKREALGSFERMPPGEIKLRIPLPTGDSSFAFEDWSAEGIHPVDGRALSPVYTLREPKNDPDVPPNPDDYSIKLPHSRASAADYARSSQ